jgi:hypothetical protein
MKCKNVFPNSALSAAIENFVAVKSDGRKGPNEEGQPQPTLFLALVETITASLEYSPDGYAITSTG